MKRIMKTYLLLKGGREWEMVIEDELDQSSFYAHMKISQWIPFVQQIYANKYVKK
jgi:hypothetical protein